MIKKIISLSNKLDENGLHRESNALDELLTGIVELLSGEELLDSAGGEGEGTDKPDKPDEDSADEEQVAFEDHTTENFDLCPGAVAAFSKLKELNLDEDSSGLVMASMQTTDALLGIEKKAIEAESASEKDLDEVIGMARNISHYAGILSTMLDDDFTSDFEFLDMHVRKIAELSLK